MQRSRRVGHPKGPCASVARECESRSNPLFPPRRILLQQLRFSRADGTVTFRSTQPNWAEAQEFARAFSEAHSPLVYRLQTQAVLTHEALLLLPRPKRVNLSPANREKLVASQDRRCTLCNAELVDYEVDHTQLLGSFGRNSLFYLAALCIPCHSAKTRSGSLSRLEPDPLSSEFAPDVYEHFVDFCRYSEAQANVHGQEFGNGPKLYMWM